MKSEASPPIQWIRNNKDLLVKFIQQIVRIPSVSGNEKDVQVAIYKKLEELNLNPKYVYPDIDILRKHEDFFETTSFTKVGYKNRPNVAGVLRGQGNGRSICLSGHIDVVSPEPITHWTKDPWGAESDEEYIYGRGAADMKSGVGAAIFAIQALKETNTLLKGDVHIETTIDEEDGGIGGNLFMRLTQPKTDAAIIPEDFSHITLGIASAGVMYFRITVSGLPAHAAAAHIGVNAILKMRIIIDALENLNVKRQSEIHYKYAEVSDVMKGKATTINIGVIKSGDWPSTVPALCTLECRIGFPPGEKKEDVMEQVENSIKNAAMQDTWLKEHPPNFEWYGWNARPYEQDPDHPFVKILYKKVEKYVGVKPILFGGTAGMDTRFFGHNGTPVVAYGPYGERGHSVDERVSINSVVKVVEVIIGTIIEWCGEN
jgi:acetylornithine deacetylase